MSTSELFVVRHKLLSTSFAEFKRTVEAEAAQIDHQIFENLAIEVYDNEKYRKNWIDYIVLFATYVPPHPATAPPSSTSWSPRDAASSRTCSSTASSRSCARSSD